MTISNEIAQSPAKAGLNACIAPGRFRGALHAMFDRSTLPPDVIDDEVTEVICFKASLMLNRALGGAADMTFSARIHRASEDRNLGPRRYLWKLAEMGVDTACGVLRGEAHHCETAWVNYCRRPGVTVACDPR